MVSLSNHARAARDSAHDEGRTNRKGRHRFAVSPLFLLFLIQVGCTSAPQLDVHKVIIRLCTGLLPLPDTTPDGTARVPFEEKMVQIGLFKRLGRVHLRDHRLATLYDVAPTRAAALNYATIRSGSQPAIVRVCFGTIRATQFTRLVKKSDNEYFADYRYEVDLKPWARTLYSFLHLPGHGAASDFIILRPDGGLWSVGLRGIPMKHIEWPPSGVPWYAPGAFPVKFRWPPIRV
jgi:hypothetical protein